MRLATFNDTPAVVGMLRRFLAEQEDLGSPVRLTTRTLDEYRDLARSYMMGSRFGLVVLDTHGMVIIGEDTGAPRFDTTLGKLAVVWIAYVVPEARDKKLALSMLHFALPHVRDLGFDTAVMGVREGNAAGRALTEGFGAQLTERIYHYSLKG